MDNKVERPELHMNDANWRTYQKYLGKQMLKKGHGVVLPAGVVVDGRPWRGFKHSVQMDSYVMAKPEDLLKDPDPRATYCWRPRTDPRHSTEGLVRRGKLIPVDFDRIDPSSKLAHLVYEYSGAAGDGEVVGMVGLGDFSLFEVPPKMKYEWYEEPVDAAYAALMGLSEGLQADAEAWAAMNPGYKVERTEMSHSDSASVPEEARNPRHSSPVQVFERNAPT